MSRLEQHLAAAVSDSWLIVEYPLGFCFLCLILYLFRFFPFGLKSGLKRGFCPPVLLRGILVVLGFFVFRSSWAEQELPPFGRCWQGPQHGLSCSLSFALMQQRQTLISVFHLVWAFRRKSLGKPSSPLSYSATCI